MSHHFATAAMCLATALLASRGSAIAQQSSPAMAPVSYAAYLSMGADRGLAIALQAVRDNCPLRMGAALAGAVKEINAAPERDGRPPAALDTADPQSFITLYNRIAAEEPRIDPQALLRHVATGIAVAVGPKDSQAGYVNLNAYKPPSASVGLEMKSDAGRIVVVRALPDSPAERAGLKPEDRIVAVDAAGVTGLYLDEVVAKLRGVESSPVELTVRRAGEAGDLKFPLVRQTIRFPADAPKMRMEGRVAVITLPAFNDDTAKTLTDLLRNAQQSRAAGYIIDLRNNPGARLDLIITAVSLFIDSGVVLSVAPPPECGSTETPDKYIAWRGFKLKRSPVIILVDKQTSAGAEIFAAAMAESGRARLVGQKTAGLGGTDTIIPLVNNGAMRMKTGELATARGVRISDGGVTPTVEIPETEDALSRALQLLAKP